MNTIVDEIGLVLGLLFAMMLLMAVAGRSRVAYPIVLVVGGLALGFAPGLPALELNPELVLLGFLPPLLYADAYDISWREFRQRLRTISLLAVALVALTVVAVAALAHWLLPALSWPAAFVLGGVVAPTDAVAALAIAHRLPLHRALVTVVAGESLLNDATGLVAYRLAIAATLTGVFTWGELMSSFAWVVAVGVAVGLALGWGFMRLQRWTGRQAELDNLLFLLLPFVSYMAAEHLHASGVLAVVACGLYVGSRTERIGSPQARLQGKALWEVITYTLNGLLFVLVGLELRAIVQTSGAIAWPTVLTAGAAVVATVIVTRVVGVFVIGYLPRWLFPAVRRRDPYPEARNVAVLSWTGMRGAISLAAALGIPTVLANGAPFPGRAEIIVVTFMVILGTLVFQGLTLPALIRGLGVKAGDEHLDEEEHARQVAIEAALQRLDELKGTGEHPAEVVEHVQKRLQGRLELLRDRAGQPRETVDRSREQAYRAVSEAAIDAERLAIVMLRDEHTIGDDVLMHLQQELDLEAVRLHGIHGED